MLFLQQTVAHGGAGEHHGHKGKPQQMRGGHKRAVADLNAQRRGGADDLGEGAEHKQRGFRVERIGGQAVFKGRPIADGLPKSFTAWKRLGDCSSRMLTPKSV